MNARFRALHRTDSGEYTVHLVGKLIDLVSQMRWVEEIQAAVASYTEITYRTSDLLFGYQLCAR